MIRRTVSDDAGMTAATPAARVAKARKGSLDRGAVRIEVILRDPAAIGALALLRDRHGSMRAAVEYAVRIAVSDLGRVTAR